jgi:peptidoglycan/LPS O-acetylase OafA/YrhL
VVVLHRNLAWHEGGNWLPLYLRTDMRLDALLLGALCAFFWQSQYLARLFNGRPAGIALFILFLAMTLLLDIRQASYYTWGAALVALLGCGFIFNCSPRAGDTRGGIFNQAWLEYLGRRSYGLYLWHFPVYLWCDTLRPGVASWVVVTIAVALTFLITEFSWRVIERPFNRRRHHYSHGTDKPAP